LHISYIDVVLILLHLNLNFHVNILHHLTINSNISQDLFPCPSVVMLPILKVV
jgi:hypothetical protein